MVHIKKINKTYKIKANKNIKEVEYQSGDLVWLHLKKESLSIRRKSKLMARGDGPFKVLAKVRANAYKLKLLEDITASATFNVEDLNPYVEDKIDYVDFRANPLKGEKDDAYQASLQDPQPANGKALLTNHLKDYFYKGKQFHFEVCLERSLLYWTP